MIVGYYDGDKLLFAGKVRAGFVPHVRHEFMAMMEPLTIDVSPFANPPEKRRTQWALTREEMKICVWLKPELVAQIEFNRMDAGQSPAPRDIYRDSSGQESARRDARADLILEALRIFEAATVECKKRAIDTPEVRETRRA